MKQNIHPKLLEPRSLTLKRKAEELATPCDPHDCVLMYGSDGNVQIWPNDSDAANKKRWNSSPKLKKQRTSGYSNSSTPTPCQSGKGLTDPLGFEAAANNISNLLYDRDQQSMVAPQPSPKSIAD
ncbi:hypothetical protein M0R45_033268 [Rubus argutus]|uniref:MADS-box domain-containing protein n=1 Tax=Rubus argutus TaxID=59490 RepID=A0AAW1WKN1_RUBAR